MNKHLIEKIIRANTEICPEFTYENPVLDRKVARALSKSFLQVYKQNSNVSSNLRHSILERIRKICQVEPEEHFKVDENFTELLTEFYHNHVKKSSDILDSTERMLDTFLLRTMKDTDINSRFKTSLNPEIIQALANLNGSSEDISSISRDIIHWNAKDQKCLNVLKDMWNNSNLSDNLQDNLTDDFSIKLKSEIERTLLEISHRILEDREVDIDSILSNNPSYKKLIKTCSVSPQCFQICSQIFNSLFINVNFDPRMQSLIAIFIENVKLKSTLVTFSSLYPVNLSHIVLLLDVELDIMPQQLKNNYIQTTINYLKNMYAKSENNLLLLLSHFPQWFDIYFIEKYEIIESKNI